MRLKKGNVERIAESELQAQRLMSDGYVKIDSPAGQEEAAGGRPDKPLEEMTVDQLRAIAKEKGIGGYYSLAKQDLLELLREAV
ncbi:MAG: transcription termination factor Rho [Lachnospiraceae bacterium]|nr:transcription termination factor Rho [Lachnospiraceae bacterium]